ncbi:MAG: UbiA family prenyltransferase, partial [Planctomycetota bacterium]
MSDAESVGADASPVVAFGRLVRIALAPSAIADVLTGLAIGYAGSYPDSPLAWLLVPASFGVYHGAMALNDWSDRKEDARTRPERPIPSGAIAAPLALGISFVLLSGGLMWAGAASPRAGLWMLAVAGAAVAYDLAGRGPLRGPVLLGLCRAGNLGVGAAAPWLMSAAEAGPGPFPVGLAPLLLAYGAHVFFLSRLGRLEDDEDADALDERPTDALRGVAVTAILLPLAAYWAVRGAGDGPGPALAGLAVAFGLGLKNAAGARASARKGGEGGWTRADVGRATGSCLRRLPFVSASVASAA